MTKPSATKISPVNNTLQLSARSTYWCGRSCVRTRSLQIATLYLAWQATAEPVGLRTCPAQLAEQAEESAILQKAAAYFAKRLEWSLSLSKSIGLSSVSKPCAAYFVSLAAAARKGLAPLQAGQLP